MHLKRDVRSKWACGTHISVVAKTDDPAACSGSASPVFSLECLHGVKYDYYEDDFEWIMALMLNLWFSCSALLEAFSFWIIDFYMCEKCITLHQDQLDHMVFKILHCVILYMTMNS
jgi:hypothetical protein